MHLQKKGIQHFTDGEGKLMDDRTVLRILEEQERVFHFDKFDGDDAWKLGCCLIEEAKERGFQPAFSIRMNNGYTVFQYGFTGTGLDHSNWMTRKENLVKVKQMSSLRCHYLLKEIGENMKDVWFLDPMDNSDCGGAFPILLNGFGMVGCILASGISALNDHDVIIGGLCRFFGKNNIERICD